MKVLLTHPTGNKNVRAVLDALETRDTLFEFHTTIGFTAYNSFTKWLPTPIRKELARRNYEIKSSKVKRHPWREFARIFLPKLGLRKYTLGAAGFASIDQVYQNLDLQVSKRLRKLKTCNAPEVVYGYEDGALNAFIAAKEQERKTVYELPIAYWGVAKKLMREETDRLPIWNETVGGAQKDSDEKMLRKESELRLADLIIVPSLFVANTLPAWTEKKNILIAPFGSPKVDQASVFPVKKKDNSALRILFVGSMSQRKGLGDLFTAMHLLKEKNVELVVMGTLLAPLQFYRNIYNKFIYEGTRPHGSVLELMRTCDVFCLPSIVEGRALVMQEAMSQGLPLIITPNTGGEDLVIESKTGFMVPIRSPEKIAEKINWFLENRGSLPDMSLEARNHAAGYSWTDYGNKIVNRIELLTTQIQVK